MPQRAVLAPFLGEFDRGLRQISLMFLQLPLEPLEQGKRVRRRPRKSRQDFFVEQPPRFSSRVLHDVLTHGHLAVRGHHHLVVAAHAQYRRPVYRRKILAHWHQKIIPRPAVATNAGFKIGSLVVSISPPTCRSGFSKNSLGSCVELLP